MKKILITSLTALALLTSAISFSATTPAPAKQAAPADTINLYTTPDATSKIVEYLPINTDLAIIINKNGWVEVGDRASGATGWLNLEQYHAAKESFYKTHLHASIATLYIQLSKDKAGKSIVEAYRNGKKLSDHDANALYQHMRAQQKSQWDMIEHFNRVVEKGFDHDFMLQKRGVDNIFEMPGMFPGIVVIENPETATEKTVAPNK